MADEEENEKGAEEEGGGGGSKLPLIIAGVNTLGLIGLAAFIMLKPDPVPTVAPPPAGGDPVAESGENLPRPDVAAEVGVMYEMGQMIINLAEPSGDRYLKAKLQLELDNEETQAELESRIAQVKYQLQVLLSGQRVADVQGPENMESLRRAMAKRINNVLPKGRVMAVWPTEWVVQ
jgi:flagellar FliL protein